MLLIYSLNSNLGLEDTMYNDEDKIDFLFKCMQYKFCHLRDRVVFKESMFSESTNPYRGIFYFKTDDGSLERINNIQIYDHGVAFFTDRRMFMEDVGRIDMENINHL